MRAIIFYVVLFGRQCIENQNVIDEIRANNFNCNIPRYVDTFEEEEPIDIQAVCAELEGITAKKQAAIDKVNLGLKLLGL